MFPRSLWHNPIKHIRSFLSILDAPRVSFLHKNNCLDTISFHYPLKQFKLRSHYPTIFIIEKNCVDSMSPLSQFTKIPSRVCRGSLPLRMHILSRYFTYFSARQASLLNIESMHGSEFHANAIILHFTIHRGNSLIRKRSANVFNWY